MKYKYYTEAVKNIGVGFVIIEKRIELPIGKTTTKGEYPKLAEDVICEFPERANCNYGDFFNRCEYMKYVNGWKCTIPNHYNVKEKIRNE